MSVAPMVVKNLVTFSISGLLGIIFTNLTYLRAGSQFRRALVKVHAGVGVSVPEDHAEWTCAEGSGGGLDATLGALEGGGAVALEALVVVAARSLVGQVGAVAGAVAYLRIHSGPRFELGGIGEKIFGNKWSPPHCSKISNLGSIY